MSDGEIKTDQPITSARKVRQALFHLGRWVVTASLIVYVLSKITWNDQLTFAEQTWQGEVVDRSPTGVHFRTSQGLTVFFPGESASDFGATGQATGQAVLSGRVVQRRKDALVFETAGAGVVEFTYDRIAYDDHGDPRVDKGFLSIWGSMRVLMFVVAVLIYPLALIVGGFRWAGLMKVHGILPGVGQCIRLTWIGFFWSLIFPGVTGGDLVKAVMIARRTAKRAIAVMTVLVDRIIGIIAMALLSGLVILANVGQAELRVPGIIVGVFTGWVFLGAVVFFSRRIRRWLFVDTLLEVLPFQRIVGEVDRAVFAYRHHKGTIGSAFLLSLIAHMATVTTVYCLGEAVGTVVHWKFFFIFVPVILMISAIPISIAGLGFMESMFQGFLGAAAIGGSPNQALAICLLFRAVTVLAAVPGALLYLVGGERPTQEMVQELEETDDEQETVPENPNPDEPEPSRSAVPADSVEVGQPSRLTVSR